MRKSTPKKATKPAKSQKPAKRFPPSEGEASKPEAQDFDIPKTLGACADKLFDLRAERLEHERMAERARAYAQAITDHLIEELPKDSAEGIVGKRARAVVTMKRFPIVNDWAKFYAHITKTKGFELLQRRVSEAAVKERWEAGKQVPGVEAFNKPTISVTKR